MHPLSHGKRLSSAEKWTSVSPWYAVTFFFTTAGSFGSFDLFSLLFSFVLFSAGLRLSAMFAEFMVRRPSHACLLIVHMLGPSKGR